MGHTCYPKAAAPVAQSQHSGAPPAAVQAPAPKIPVEMPAPIVPVELPPKVSPWIPMSRPIDLKHIGKLGEELGEAAAAAARCVIQGIDAREPETGKLNRLWLQEEIADVLANIELNVEHFGLDRAGIERRKRGKMARLREWHGMLAP